MAAIFEFNGSGRLEREIDLYQRGWPTVKTKEKNGGRVVKIFSALSPPPTLTVHFNSKSNMAGRINDRELITLACIN